MTLKNDENNGKKKNASIKKTHQKKDKKVNIKTKEEQEANSVENLLQVEDLIKQAFLRFYNTAYTNKTKEKDLEHLSVIVEEYLKTFMILGYDLNGEKICIMHATSLHDRDALVEHLRSTLLGIVNN